MSFRDTHPSRSSIGWEHGIKVPAIRGSQTKPRATSEGRKAVGTNRIDQADNVNNMTCVNSLSSPTGIARGGKSPSRILPTEGGRYRAFGPQPRSESAGGADRSPEGDLPRRRGQIRESGDAGGRAIPGRKPVIFAAESGKHPRQPDEGRAEFTYIYPTIGRLRTGKEREYRSEPLHKFRGPSQRADKPTAERRDAGLRRPADLYADYRKAYQGRWPAQGRSELCVRRF